MNKFLKKIFTIILVLILFSEKNYCNQSFSFYDIEKLSYETLGDDFNNNYNMFLDSFGKNDFKNINCGWLRIRDENDKLIIGSSPVVYCGYTMGDSIDKFGYDVISYGGITDDKIKDWVIGINKKYKKIIVFEGINTLNLAAIFSFNSVTDEMIYSVFSTIASLINFNLDSDGEIVYVKAIPMVYERDNSNEELVKKYNNLVPAFNNALTFLNNIQLYDIPFPTTNEYSHGYVHFNNRIVWEDLLK